MNISIIDEVLIDLTNALNKLKIDYVIVGGISVIIHGRIRTTMDIDVILDHSKIDPTPFLETMNDRGFDANRDDLLGFEEKIHVSIFHKKTMFRIDFKGAYTEKELISIKEAVEVSYQGHLMKIDNPINLIVNKLLFGADFDLEDVISVLENYPELKSNKVLLDRLKEFNVLEKFQQLLTDLSKI
ncbi:MAG: DUF6036 family nucleotidyltransferase [Candidatus Kariarchaeaceae archaeon]|jgi:hypothetical protein